jgi:hypothetical protein
MAESASMANALSAVVFVSLVTLAAQQARSIDPTAVPVEQEPQHHLVFTNEFVRVIDARFPPGYKSLSHTHTQDNVAVTIATGRNDAASLARVGRAGFSAGGYSHVVTNAGPIEMRFIAVELLRADSSAARPFADEPMHKLETQNDRVRIYRVRLMPGESLTPHTHSAGWLGVTVTGGRGPGTFEWHPAESADPLRGGDSGLEIVELEPR